MDYYFYKSCVFADAEMQETGMLSYFILFLKVQFPHGTAHFRFVNIFPF